MSDSKHLTHYMHEVKVGEIEFVTGSFVKIHMSMVLTLEEWGKLGYWPNESAKASISLNDFK